MYRSPGRRAIYQHDEVTAKLTLVRRGGPRFEDALSFNHAGRVDSAKIPRVRSYLSEPMRVIPNVLGDNVDNATLALQLTLYNQ